MAKILGDGFCFGTLEHSIRLLTMILCILFEGNPPSKINFLQEWLEETKREQTSSGA